MTGEKLLANILLCSNKENILFITKYCVDSWGFIIVGMMESFYLMTDTRQMEWLSFALEDRMSKQLFLKFKYLSDPWSYL